MTGDTTINFAKILGQECVAMRIRLISRAISRIYDDALRPHGLKGSQLSILALVSVLRRAEPSEVCRILQLDASTFSRNVTRMRSNGWLEASSTDDRRAHRLGVTAKGNQLLVEAFPSWRRAQEKAMSLLGKDSAAAISRIAEALWRERAAV